MKKRRHRTWWFPVFSKEVIELQARQQIGDVEKDVYPVLFDDKMTAYGYAVGRRLDVKRDKDGNVILNKDGHAQLKQPGKITLIGIKGKAIDWKKVEILKEKPESVKGEAFAADYNIPINKQTLAQVFEESDEMYNQYAGTPLAQAGGIKKIESDTPTTEEVQPVPEH